MWVVKLEKREEELRGETERERAEENNKSKRGRELYGKPVTNNTVSSTPSCLSHASTD